VKGNMFKTFLVMYLYIIHADMPPLIT